METSCHSLGTANVALAWGPTVARHGPAVGGPESDSDSEPDCEPGPDSDELAESARDSLRSLAQRAEAACPLRGISGEFRQLFPSSVFKSR